MPLTSKRLMVLPLAGLLVLSLLAHAQSTTTEKAPQSQKVTMATIDDVYLQGTFYPSNQEGSRSASVLLIHSLGSDRSASGWDKLATQLQSKGYSVMSFDLRGHGESKDVKAENFWKVPSNVKGIKGATQKKQQIEFKEFTTSYYPMLVNDIAAAKYELERRNNSKQCNASNTIIVAAEDSAALAALWIAAEWERRKAKYNQLGYFIGWEEPEGKDIAGAVWLSIRPELGPKDSKVKRPTIPLSTIFGTDALRKKTNMCFMYGTDDKQAKTNIKNLYDGVLQPKKNNKLTVRSELDGDVVGQDLLGKDGLDTTDRIVQYLEEMVMKNRPGTVWTDREMKNYKLQWPAIQKYVTLP